MKPAGGDNIDNLSFGIILKDEDFKKKMGEVKTMAEKFSKDVERALDLTKKLNALQGKGNGDGKKKVDNEQRVVNLLREELELKKAEGTITKKELQTLNAILRNEKLESDVRKKETQELEAQTRLERQQVLLEKSKGTYSKDNTTELHKQNAIMKGLTSMAAQYLSVFGAVSLVRNLVRITGEFEAQHTALRAILQDSAGADRVFYQLQELAVKSPYTFRDLTSYAKQLSAFSVPMDEIYDTTKKLADVSAGLGVDMGRIILAYGQVRSAAFLRGQEVRQFTEAGIPILAELAKQFEEIEGHAISTGEVFDRISKRQVPFEMVEEAFRRMTSEGGKFYNMQEVLAETVKGKISNLQDSWEIMLSKVGDANSGLIKGSISLITELINNYEKLGKVIIEVTAAYGAYKAALIATNALQSASAVSARFLAVTGGQISAIDVLLNRLFRTAKGGFSKILGVVTKHPVAAAIGAVTAGLVTLYFHIRKVNEATRETEKITTKAIADAEATKSSIHYYIQRLKEAKEGTEEYNKARQAVIDNSGNFISSTDAERLSLQNVDDVWVNICNHIEEATKLQAMQSVTADAEARRQKEQLEVMDKLAKYQNDAELSNETRMNVASYIRQEITRDELERRLMASGLSAGNGGYYSPGSISDILFNADNWWEDFYDAEREYYKAVNLAKQKLNDLYGSGVKSTPAAPMPLEGWRVAVDDYLKAIGGGTRGMEVTSATDLASYIKKGADALDAARDALLHTPKNDADYKRLEEEIKFYEGISQAIYGKGFTEFDNTTNKYKTSQKELSKAQRERLAELKQQVENLKTIYNTYKSLAPMFTDEAGNVNENALASVVSNLLGGSPVPKNMDEFASAFQTLADSISAIDSNSAQDVLNLVAGMTSRDIAAEYKASVAAQKALDDYLKSWNIGSETEGIGSTFKITKIVSDYEEALEGLNDKRDEATKKLNAWVKAEKAVGNVVEDATKAEKENEIATKYQTAATNLLNKATEDVRKTASDYLEEWAKANNIDISDWSHKTIYELNRIQKELDNFDASNLPQEIIDALNKAGIDIEKFKEAIKAVAGEKSGHAQVLADEKKWDYALQSAEALAGLFDKIAEYAESAGNSKLFSFASGFATSFRTMGDIAEKVAKQDYIGAVISGVTSIASAFLESAKNVAELERNIRKSKIAAEQLRLELELGRGVDGLFGENELQSISNAWEKASEKFKVVSDDIAKAKEKLWGGTDNDTNGWATAGGVAAGAGLGAGIGVWFFGVGALIGAAIGAVVGAISGAAVDIAKETDNFQRSLEDMAKELNAPLYDEKTGLFNVDTLNLILETYDQLDEKSKEVIESMIAHTTEYETALEQLSEGVKNVFGQVADEIANNMVDAFKQSGEAALDYADIMDDVATSLATMVIKAGILNTVLTDEKAMDIAGKIAQGKVDEALAIFDDTMKEAESLSSSYQPFLQGIQRYFKTDTGEADSKSSNSLSGGIKSITEDTANLLASYLNAIRADVSYGKTQWERIAIAVEGQNTRYITLNDYMMQVQANTANIAESNRRILQEMQGFIRDFSLPSGYGESLKVQIVN